MTPNVFKLIDACCDVRDNPRLIPSEEVTHCNEAVIIISQRMGCDLLVGLMANQMVDLMSDNSNFTEIGIDQAQDIANQGLLVIAGQKGNPHGHVCAIRPGIAIESLHWRKKAPRIVNIGKNNFIDRGLSWAFQDEPRLWAWKP